MVLISHRGNINGRFESYENEPAYIDHAIEFGYDVEIDLWMNDGVLYLGHDAIQYGITLNWLEERKSKLWIHCKNVDVIEYLSNKDLHYFWHEEDTLTLTSKGYMWVYPGKQPVIGSIAVMPEIHNDDISKCYGVCSDYIQKYKK